MSLALQGSVPTDIGILPPFSSWCVQLQKIWAALAPYLMRQAMQQSWAPYMEASIFFATLEIPFI